MVSFTHRNKAVVRQVVMMSTVKEVSRGGTDFGPSAQTTVKTGQNQDPTARVIDQCGRGLEDISTRLIASFIPGGGP